MKLARLWTQDCLNNHDTCREGHVSGANKFLPTRLIDVRDPGRPFLRTTSDAPAIPPGVKYIALSYAWGEGERVVTTKENIQSHGHQIPTGNLPQTFADAFETTRLLEYQDIWVDAFCIAQNDKDDLSNELPHMGDIYRFAEFTIFAEGAANAGAGLFQARDPYLYRPCTLDVKATTEHDTISETLTLTTRCTGPNYLKSRGWILQEEILTSKSLIFGKQLAWKCTTSEASEMKPCPQPRRSVLREGQMTGEDRLRLWIYAPDRMRSAQRKNWFRWNHYDAWYAVLEAYSSRELSFDSDRLPALSGLADLFQRAHSSTYAAGLWQEDLQVGLAWYVASNDRRPAKKDRAQAPSWSWASVGMVRLRYRSWRANSSHEVESGAKILDVSCELENELNPYGRVEKGTLKIHTRIKKGMLRCSSRYMTNRTEHIYGSYSGPDSATMTKGESPRFPALVYDMDSPDVIGEVALDAPIHTCLEPGIDDKDFLTDEGEERGISFKTGIWCAILHVQKSGDVLRGTALVSERVQTEPPTYRRLGLMFIKEHSESNSSLFSWKDEIMEIY